LEKYNLPVEYNKLKSYEKKLVREQYIKAQNNLCYLCKMPLDGEPSDKIKSFDIKWKLFPPNFLKYPVHLHHSHKTGLTIGCVHALCNAVLWQYLGE
jgi:hypothetical protein